jgi:hypothetical protein
LIVQEANAIGTAYLRPGLLTDPYASQVRHILAEYVAHRLEASQHIATGLGPDLEPKAAAFHARLWQAARDGSLARPELMKVVLDPVNEVIDLHSTRMASVNPSFMIKPVTASIRARVENKLGRSVRLRVSKTVDYLAQVRRQPSMGSLVRLLEGDVDVGIDLEEQRHFWQLLAECQVLYVRLREGTGYV